MICITFSVIRDLEVYPNIQYIFKKTKKHTPKNPYSEITKKQTKYSYNKHFGCIKYN